jgi:hypothetical protein
MWQRPNGVWGHAPGGAWFPQRPADGAWRQQVYSLRRPPQAHLPPINGYDEWLTECLPRLSDPGTSGLGVDNSRAEA